MKISKKNYICLVCGNISIHETNHEGEIYCRCKSCGNLGLHPESRLNIFDNVAPIAIFHFYYLNMEKKEEKEKYLEMCNYLKTLNYKKFDTFYDFKLTEFWKQWDNEKIKIINPEQFEDQYISNKGRLFQWSEAVFDNKTLKKGYYLEF